MGAQFDSDRQNGCFKHSWQLTTAANTGTVGKRGIRKIATVILTDSLVSGGRVGVSKSMVRPQCYWPSVKMKWQKTQAEACAWCTDGWNTGLVVAPCQSVALGGQVGFSNNQGSYGFLDSSQVRQVHTGEGEGVTIVNPSGRKGAQSSPE